MKRKLSILIASVLLLLIGCNKTEQSGYISLSDNSCSFNYEGGSTIVRISASGSWHATTNDNWLSVEESQNSLEITVDENTQKAERIGEIIVISDAASEIITIYQAGNIVQQVTYRKNSATKYSPSREFAGAVRGDNENDVATFYIGFFDLRNDKSLQYGPFIRDSYPIAELAAVADNGNMYMINESSGNVYLFTREDASIERIATNAKVYSCSSDGSVAVGYTEFSTAGTDFPKDFPLICYPTKWVNGVAEKLSMPEKPFKGDAYDWYAGLIPRAVSADGKIVYGTEWQDVNWYMIWWDENNDWHYVGEDVRKLENIPVSDGTNTYLYALASGMINSNAAYAMTPSGNWICGWYHDEQVREDGAIIGTYYPAFYNVKQNKTHIFWDYPDSRAVTVYEKDGIGFIRTNSIPLQGNDVDTSTFYAVDIEGESTISTVQEWYFDNYGIYPPVTSMPYGFSEDYKIATFVDGSYIVDKR